MYIGSQQPKPLSSSLEYDYPKQILLYKYVKVAIPTRPMLLITYIDTISVVSSHELCVPSNLYMQWKPSAVTLS